MKKRSSNQIRNFIIAFVILMILVLIGLIIFLLTVDIKNIRNYGERESVSNNITEEKVKDEQIDISDYELVKTSYDGEIEVRLSDQKLFFSVKIESLFKEMYPKAIIDINKSSEIVVHENRIEDFCIGKIGEKNYLFVLTDNGSIGVMNINEAVENDVFRIKNKLITFEKSVVRVSNFAGKLDNGTVNTVIVVTEDGKKYDLSKFVE